MNLFTRNSPYYNLLKYLLFILKHPVYNLISVFICILINSDKIKIYRTAVLPVMFYGCETWSLSLLQVSALYGKGPHSLLGAGSQTACGKIIIQGC